MIWKKQTEKFLARNKTPRLQSDIENETGPESVSNQQLFSFTRAAGAVPAQDLSKDSITIPAKPKRKLFSSDRKNKTSDSELTEAKPRKKLFSRGKPVEDDDGSLKPAVKKVAKIKPKKQSLIKGPRFIVFLG